jgi:hypothetical protein
MSETLDIGKRIELISMDAHFEEISIGLYEQQGDGKPVYLVHTYSTKDGAQERVAFLLATMKTLGGLESDEEGRLYFACGSDHALAIKRVFIDSAKVSPEEEVVARPLSIHDRKTGLEVAANSLGDGRYRVGVEGNPEESLRRITAIARGLAKLGEMETNDEQTDSATFACGKSHDALVGLLLIRAPNVRAAIREAEMLASRGVLSAPSAQE